MFCHYVTLPAFLHPCFFLAWFWRAAKPRFFEGLLHLLLLDVPMWAIQTLKLLRPLRKETIQIAKDLDDLKQFLGYRADVVSMWETRQTKSNVHDLDAYIYCLCWAPVSIVSGLQFEFRFVESFTVICAPIKNCSGGNMWECIYIYEYIWIDQ